jgi:hypothetical protein
MLFLATSLNNLMGNTSTFIHYKFRSIIIIVIQKDGSVNNYFLLKKFKITWFWIKIKINLDFNRVTGWFDGLIGSNLINFFWHSAWAKEQVGQIPSQLGQFFLTPSLGPVMGKPGFKSIKTNYISFLTPVLPWKTNFLVNWVQLIKSFFYTQLG